MKKLDYLSTLFVGIDIGARQNVISSINFEQEFLIKMKPIPNTQFGADQLEAILVKILENNTFKAVIIGLESTSFYGVHIANFLSASEKLMPYKPYVYCLNPKEVANYKESFNSLDKCLYEPLTASIACSFNCIQTFDLVLFTPVAFLLNW